MDVPGPTTSALPRPAPAEDARPPLRRPVEGRWVAGVAAGTATHLRVPVPAVRAALVVLVVATAGVAAVAYPLLWAVVPGEARPGTSGPSAPAGRTDGRGGLLGPGDRTQVLVGAALAVVGAALLAEQQGLPVPVSTVVAATACLAGLLLAWGRLEPTERERWRAGVGGADGAGAWRLAAGLVLATFGLVLLTTGPVEWATLRVGVLAGGAVLVGVLLVLAPWGLQLVRDLREERAGRLRAVERAEIAAELHDSVLQVLALVQRHSDDPAEVSRLARSAERELRAWLRRGGPAPATDLAAAVRDAVAEVEDAVGVAVEVVTVGADGARLGDARRALVMALREAVLNAVRHGRPPVQVFCEVEGRRTTAFVRDHGDGLDLEAVPADRLGLRESVIGRMQRHGGSAVVRRPPGGGTEIALAVEEQP